MKKNQVVLAAGLILFTMVCACKKENSLTSRSNDPLLSEIIVTQNDSIGYVFFKYNDQNKLISIVDSSNDQLPLVVKTFIDYDANGSPTGFSSSIPEWHSDGNGYSIIVFLDTFSFLKDGPGRIIGAIEKDKNLYANQNPLDDSHVYGYDNNGRLVSDSGHHEAGTSHIHFDYSNTNDVTQWQYIFFDNSTNQMESSVGGNITYDDNPSAYTSLGSLYYLIVSRPEFLSAHNPLQDAGEGYTVNYSYQYNTNGFPSQAQFTKPWDGTTDRLQFVYK